MRSRQTDILTIKYEVEKVPTRRYYRRKLQNVEVVFLGAKSRSSFLLKIGLKQVALLPLKVELVPCLHFDRYPIVERGTYMDLPSIEKAFGPRGVLLQQLLKPNSILLLLLATGVKFRDDTFVEL